MLLALRERAVTGANYVAEAITEDIAPPGSSAAPVHLADAAGETLEADLGAFQAEVGLLGQINGALDRIENGSYGKCAECGAEIGKTRLDAVPYASLCIQCAHEVEQEPEPLT
jgi:RNA polymerase-binding transcription factor DksA